MIALVVMSLPVIFDCLKNHQNDKEAENDWNGDGVNHGCFSGR